MDNKNQYHDLITEIISKQILILGPDIALHKAEQVAGLKLDKDGKILSLGGDEQAILQQLVDKYIELSGEIVKNILTPVFAKYPSINIKIK